MLSIFIRNNPNFKKYNKIEKIFDKTNNLEIKNNYSKKDNYKYQLNEYITEEHIFYIPMILDIHLIFKNLCKLDTNESEYLFIYVNDFIKIIDNPIIKKFKGTEMNKLANSYCFIKKLFLNLKNKIDNNNIDIGKTKLNFELFILLLNESINIYKYYIAKKINKKIILKNIVLNNINIIDSKNYNYYKFLDQFKNKNFKYYLVNINLIFEKITKNYLIDYNNEYISLKIYLKLLLDYKIIPNYITKFKAIFLFFSFNIISNWSYFNLKKNSIDNPIFYLFILELRKKRINRLNLIELFYFILLEFFNYKIINGDFFYNTICEIFDIKKNNVENEKLLKL